LLDEVTVTARLGNSGVAKHLTNCVYMTRMVFRLLGELLSEESTAIPLLALQCLKANRKHSPRDCDLG